jgi:uncharacterized protein
MEITVKNTELKLLPQKAIFWKKEKTLLISDLHLGKISHFRKEGIPLPLSAFQNNFDRLDDLILNYNAWQVIFIGDLFHSTINKEWDQFCTWRKKYHSVEMHIVLGNHDKLPQDCYEDLPLKIHKKNLMIAPFTFSHHPKEKFLKDEYVISGHVHPVIKLNGKANQNFRLPCFYFGRQQAILPSFGYFTGGHAIQPKEEDKVIAVVKNELIEVSGILAS